MICTMSEIDNSGTSDLAPDQLTPLGQVFEDPELHARWETAQKLRAAQEGWLARRDLLEDTPRLTVTGREFELLGNVGLGDGDETTSRLFDKGRVEGQDGIPRITITERELKLFGIVASDSSNTSSLIQRAKELCGIPSDDQYAPPYALVDIESGDSKLPNEPLLMIITEADFGTTIDPEIIAKDFPNPGSSPDNPLMPESGAYATVDIGPTLYTSGQGLQAFAAELMRGRTANPFSRDYEDNGDIGVRAGGLAPGQKDAYVWSVAPIARSVQLTLNDPTRYDSVCVVRGQKREAPNGKASMAQIVDPTVVFTIEGEDLKKLQKIYTDLYHEPNFALTEEQGRQRDELFNNYLVGLISHEVRNNKAREQAQRDDERARLARQQPLRARERPLS